MTSQVAEDRALHPRRALAPIGVAIGVLGAALLAQLVFDPFRQDVPLCLFHALTGLQCPGCGMSRGVHALLAGDLMLALRSNAMLVVLIPGAAWIWARWTRARLHGERPAAPPRGLVIAVLALVLLYTILRNLPAFSFLAPISYVAA